MSKPDSELMKVSALDFVMRLTEPEKHRWLEIVDDSRVTEALNVCVEHEMHATKQLVRDAQDRRATKSAEISADRRHGEEMTAAAVANHLARKALAVGIGAMILALIAILQQCRG